MAERNDLVKENQRYKNLLRVWRTVVQTSQNNYDHDDVLSSLDLNLKTFPFLDILEQQNSITHDKVQALLETAPKIVSESSHSLDMFDCGTWNNDGAQLEMREMQVSPNGSRYLGCWDRSHQHGYGLSLSTSGDYYEGFWCKGVPHFRGRMIYANGIVIEGDWENGNPIRGKIIQPSGKVFDGYIKG